MLQGKNLQDRSQRNNMQLTSLMAHKKPKENESVTPTRPQIKTKKYEKDITNKTKSKDDKIK